MAIFKQGQINQILAVCVDKTDFASVESGVTSNFTCTLYGYKQNSSAATSAVTLSAAPSVVRSGIIRVKIKAAETSGVDNALLKIAHASCADQYIPITFQIQDLSDAISDAQSDLRSYLAGMSDIQSKVYGLLSDLDSNFQSRVPKEVANASRLLLAESVISDAHSAAAAANTAATAAASRALLNQSMISDIYSLLSDVSSDLTDLSGVVSDFYSDFQSRVPKAVATASRLLLAESAISDAHSAATLAASRALVNQSSLSDLQSYVVGISASLSDVESQIDAGVTLTASHLGTVADKFLNRSIQGGADSGRTVKQALYPNRNKVVTDGTTSVVKVYDETDASVAWSAAIVTTAGDPITTVDP